MENALLQKVAVEFSAHFMNENAEHYIAEIAIAPLFAGLKSQWNCFCAREQMSYRYVLPTCWRVGEIFRDLVVETELAFFDQHHHSRRRKLLAHRARLKNSFGLRRYLKLDIGEAVTLCQDDLSVFDYGQRQSRDALPLHLGFDVIVNLCRDRVLRGAGHGNHCRRQKRA